MKKSVTQWSVRLHTYIAGGAGGGRAAVRDAGDGISVICQIYEIRSWRFRQEIITAKRYIGEEWKIIGSFPRGYYCHLQCWYQSEWCRTYKWHKLWIVFQKKSSKENGLRSVQLIILKICNILSFLLENKPVKSSVVSRGGIIVTYNVDIKASGVELINDVSSESFFKIKVRKRAVWDPINYLRNM